VCINHHSELGLGMGDTTCPSKVSQSRVCHRKGVSERLGDAKRTQEKGFWLIGATQTECAEYSLAPRGK